MLILKILQTIKICNQYLLEAKSEKESGCRSVSSVDTHSHINFNSNNSSPLIIGRRAESPTRPKIDLIENHPETSPLKLMSTKQPSWRTQTAERQMIDVAQLERFIQENNDKKDKVKQTSTTYLTCRCSPLKSYQQTKDFEE